MYRVGGARRNAVTGRYIVDREFDAETVRPDDVTDLADVRAAGWWSVDRARPTERPDAG